MKTGTASGSAATVSPSFALMQQVITKYATVNKKTTGEVTQDSTAKASPPGSPVPSTTKPQPSPVSTVPVPGTSSKPRTASESPDQGDVDMEIIKAPIVTKGICGLSIVKIFAVFFETYF